MEHLARFIDLHSHPHGKAFNFLRNSNQFGGKHYHPWTVILSNFRAQKKGKRAFSYAQCDLAKLWNGHAAVIFASLYPFEKGFFRGGGRLDQDGINNILDVLDRIPVLDGLTMALFRRSVHPLVSSEDGVTSAKDHFQSLLMRLPRQRINFIQSNRYDYYEELQEEYRFLQTRNGTTTRTHVHGTPLQRLRWKLFPKKSAKDSTEATGTYVLARNATEVQQAVAERQVVFVLTIEGMHALGTDTHLENIMERIAAIKQWPHPIFFITFAHHFNNFLCGHAHSMPREATLFVNQRDGLQAPFTEIGWAALRYLLSLTPANVKNTASLGRRIFIDVKHMGATARRQFYEQVVRPCRAQGDTIPVIASHVGYTGISRLRDLEKNFADGRETDDEWQHMPGLNPWNINACLEDVEEVILSGGLLGLCLDQRILGLRKKEETPSLELLWNNVQRLVDDVRQSANIPATDKSRVWEVLCLGTDFEGYIDPADDYPTVLQFDKLEQDITARLQAWEQQGQQATWLMTKPAADIARDLCMNNVMRFLQIHFI
ncbi:MAG: hypothetical protein ACK5DD_04150 [Cyclobacteriaceae bacterium]|jgi:hypothetical protein